MTSRKSTKTIEQITEDEFQRRLDNHSAPSLGRVTLFFVFVLGVRCAVLILGAVGREPVSRPRENTINDAYTGV
jgi:hypothetical protein